MYRPENTSHVGMRSDRRLSIGACRQLWPGLLSVPWHSPSGSVDRAAVGERIPMQQVRSRALGPPGAQRHFQAHQAGNRVPAGYLEAPAARGPARRAAQHDGHPTERSIGCPADGAARWWRGSPTTGRYLAQVQLAARPPPAAPARKRMAMRRPSSLDKPETSKEGPHAG